MTTNYLNNATRHAFLSYVRENQDIVARLFSDLTASGVSVWLDRNEIKPGSRWKDSIRAAIADGAYFLACFSNESAEKDRSYMNEELALAIEELRLRPTNRTWFIPIRLNACSIPDRAIGPGERLADIQWVDLFEDWDAGIRLLLSTLMPNRPEYKRLYEAAFELASVGLKEKTNVSSKTEQFTIGLTGQTGVGKSSILNILTGPEMVSRPMGILYDDDVTYRHWPNVARFADIPALGYSSEARAKAIEFLKNTVDLALYVISASTRIHGGDVDGVRTIQECDIPCVITLNGMDRMDSAQEAQVLSYVTKQTGCPVVPVSAFTGTNVDLLRTFIRRISQLHAGLHSEAPSGDK